MSKEAKYAKLRVQSDASLNEAEELFKILPREEAIKPLINAINARKKLDKKALLDDDYRIIAVCYNHLANIKAGPSAENSKYYGKAAEYLNKVKHKNDNDRRKLAGYYYNSVYFFSGETRNNKLLIINCINAIDEQNNIKGPRNDNDEHELAQYHHKLGALYSENKDLYLALEHCRQAVNIEGKFELGNNHVSHRIQAEYYYQLGEIYLKVAKKTSRTNINCTDTIAAMRAALSLLEHIPAETKHRGDSYLIGIYSGRLASIYFEIENWQEAINHFQRSIQSQLEQCRDSFDVYNYSETARQYFWSGIAYTHLKNYPEALGCYTKAAECALKLKHLFKTDYDLLKVICAEFCEHIGSQYNAYFFLFDFLREVFSGSGDAESKALATIHLSLPELAKHPQALNCAINLLRIIRDLCKAETFPDSPFKKYLQDPKHLDEFGQLIQKMEAINHPGPLALLITDNEKSCKNAYAAHRLFKLPKPVKDEGQQNSCWRRFICC